MAELPGQPEAIVDDDNRTTTHWYLFFRELWQSLTASWKPYTPTLSASAGAFAVASATGRYRRIGKTINVSMQAVITNVGTATGFLIATLPPNGVAASHATLVAREIAITGKMMQGQILSGATVVQLIGYDNLPVLPNGAQIVVSGTYEVQ